MDIQNVFIDKKISIRQTIEKLNKTAKKILVVVENNKLIGVVTDGDIRRWIVKSGELSSSVENIMNVHPIYLNIKNRNRANELMKKYRIESIPLINEYHEVVDMIFWDDLYDNKFNCNNARDISVVIMAGGKGTRLHPYTKIIPKALIPIGEIPIIERIINRFLEFKFENFYITVNYKKEIIKAYFSKKLSYKISFLEEKKPLGTAGGLSLVGNRIGNTFFVSNCDILVNANYSKILEYHKEHNNKVTVVTALKNYIIPYGILNLNQKGDIASIDEKPNYEFLINTGMYVLEVDVLRHIPKGIYFNMTDLINICLSKGEKVGIYPVTDNDWLDMGEFREMKSMIEKLNI
ncbi:nucleotidyltransferase family protein [Clostridium kluyveri]|uniref:Nucleotidyltransferase n=1 Tax=Clostridium kluyveri TaxID=1534 RepID=A0A1L5F9T9_CLOKL|nr:nucleotidyltransferase family protein [Clostridium kluyveri]APM39737.1 nucleotidyltransferase [Clostridium kluyveri]UZQ50104.1 nucleotidyltransferase family protein [Clostridium kluyveri]